MIGPHRRVNDPSQKRPICLVINNKNRSATEEHCVKADLSRLAHRFRGPCSKDRDPHYLGKGPRDPWKALNREALFAWAKRREPISAGFDWETVRGPLTHQYAPLLKMIGPMIGGLNFTFDRMSKCSFANRPWR